jgi:hypothetical protein
MFDLDQPFILLDAFLPDPIRRRLWWLLIESGQIKWDRANPKTTASRGNVLQMNAQSKDECLAFDLICRHLVDLAYQRLHTVWPMSADPSQTSMQHSSVLMEGRDPSDLPYMIPHQDNFTRDGRTFHPELTMVYYLMVDKAEGGKLLGHNASANSPYALDFSLEPVENTLVLLPGKQIHSVSPLLWGRRLSVVTNLYLSSFTAS